MNWWKTKKCTCINSEAQPTDLLGKIYQIYVHRWEESAQKNNQAGSDIPTWFFKYKLSIIIYYKIFC